MAKNDGQASPGPEVPKKGPTAWNRFLEEKGVQTAGPVVYNSSTTELSSRTERGIGAWLESPANLKMFSQAYRNLVKVAQRRGMDTGEVKYVRAARLANTDLVFILPVPEGDLGAIPCQYYSSYHWINLRALLAPVGRLLPVRHNSRYDMHVVGEDSPVGHALVFDLSAPLAHRVDPLPKKKTKAKTGTDQSKGGQDQGKSGTDEAPSGEQPNPDTAAAARDDEAS